MSISAIRFVFFRSGVTAVIVKDVRTVEGERERLMIRVMIDRRISSHYFTTWVGTGSR